MFAILAEVVSVGAMAIERRMGGDVVEEIDVEIRDWAVEKVSSTKFKEVVCNTIVNMDVGP